MQQIPPPVANPPSKRPILTLFKQARAFGLGVVLTTQNPVDLDYKGLTNAGIAARLHLSEGTVKNYVSEILSKLQANDRTHAVVLAIRRGLLDV